jgi:hypothetical protein
VAAFTGLGGSFPVDWVATFTGIRKHGLGSKGGAVLTAEDLDWVPEKWWQLITGETSEKVAPTRVNRRQFEICVCRQLVCAVIRRRFSSG